MKKIIITAVACALICVNVILVLTQQRDESGNGNINNSHLENPQDNQDNGQTENPYIDEIYEPPPSREEQEQMFAALGRIDRKAFESRHDRSIENIFMRGDNITIYRSEVEQLIAQRQVLGEEGDHEKGVVEFLLRREALYFKARSLGYYVTDEEINWRLAVERQHYEESREGNYYVFLAYFEGTGLTMDQYFEWQFDIRKREETIGKFLDSERERFMEILGIDIHIAGWDEEPRERWHRHVQEIVDAVVRADNVQRIG